jgi:hypothetical protein
MAVDVAEYSSEDSAASSIAANDENHGEGSGGVRRSAGSFHGRGIADFFGRFCPAKNLITRATAF